MPGPRALTSSDEPTFEVILGIAPFSGFQVGAYPRDEFHIDDSFQPHCLFRIQVVVAEDVG